jgi:hypothetical protein
LANIYLRCHSHRIGFDAAVRIISNISHWEINVLVLIIATSKPWLSVLVECLHGVALPISLLEVKVAALADGAFDEFLEAAVDHQRARNATC